MDDNLRVTWMISRVVGEKRDFLGYFDGTEEEAERERTEIFVDFDCEYTIIKERVIEAAIAQHDALLAGVVPPTAASLANLVGRKITFCNDGVDTICQLDAEATLADLDGFLTRAGKLEPPDVWD